jgi:hypothetical protein
MKVTQNQSILDICLMAYGNLDSLVPLLLENGLSITDELVPGAEIKTPAVDTADSDIVNFYTRKSIKPATDERQKAVASIKVLTLGNKVLTIGGKVLTLNN